jgi:hypothetical protein
MLWLLLIVLLAVVVGVGTLVEIALWTMLLVLAVIAVAALALRSVFGRRAA